MLSAAASILSARLPFRTSGAQVELPTEVRILKWGENIGRTTGARILVDDAVTQTLSANQQLVAFDRVPMDYEHQSVPGHKNHQPDPRYSPGSGIITVKPGDGIYLSAIEYTPNGQELASSYRDVSAVVHTDADGRPVLISSVALTQAGDVEGVEFAQGMAALSAIVNLPNQQPNTTTTMDQPDYKAIAYGLLNLPADASVEDFVAAAEAAAKAPEAKPEPPAAPQDGDAVVALSARLDELQRELLVRDAARDGKVIPLSADVLKATPLATLREIIAGLPANVVPLSVGVLPPAEKPTKVTALSAEETRAARALGLTDEQYIAGRVTA